MREAFVFIDIIVKILLCYVMIHFYGIVPLLIAFGMLIWDWISRSVKDRQ